MSFSWNGRCILRRIDENDPDFHRIHKHSADPASITTADNVFTSAPVLAAKSRYDAERVEGREAWEVALAGSPNVLMGVFVLRSRP
ncbi:hypothetical protein [Janthinobacterium sp. BJB304]|uniref:hypothetical protein n=1 Tax=Janthinobacterium sp. BJB304 TaxID=1572871 RepID=UPI00117A51AE|nr:hypothetical protein [Janthinobacterium sp. BJB304]